MSQSTTSHGSTGHHASAAVTGENFCTSGELKNCYDAESLKEIAGGRPLSACATKIMAARGVQTES